jgi:hypothetical protein
MKNDKDTIAMSNICEAMLNYQVRSNKPVQQKVTIDNKSVTVRATRTLDGWKTEVWDETDNKMIPVNDYIASLILTKSTKNIEDFENSQKTISKV